MEHEAEKLQQETLERWLEAEQNRTISNKFMLAWLDSWGTNEETGRPACDK